LDSVPRQAQDALAGSSAGSTSNSNQDSEPANIRVLLLFMLSFLDKPVPTPCSYFDCS